MSQSQTQTEGFIEYTDGIINQWQKPSNSGDTRTLTLVKPISQLRVVTLLVQGDSNASFIRNTTLVDNNKITYKWVESGTLYTSVVSWATYYIEGYK